MVAGLVDDGPVEILEKTVVGARTVPWPWMWCGCCTARTAPALRCTRRFEITEGRFGRVKCSAISRLVASSITPVARTLVPVFEPAMIAAIDLDQFAQARSPGSWLMDLRRTLTARNPQPGSRHQLPDSFLRQVIRGIRAASRTPASGRNQHSGRESNYAVRRFLHPAFVPRTSSLRRPNVRPRQLVWYRSTSRSTWRTRQAANAQQPAQA